MSDIYATDLRTRIAAVLYRLWRERFPRSDPWGQLAADEREPWLTDADAVIRELDLGIPCANTGCRMRQIARRHAESSSRLEAE